MSNITLGVNPATLCIAGCGNQANAFPYCRKCHEEIQCLDKLYYHFVDEEPTAKPPILDSPKPARWVTAPVDWLLTGVVIVLCLWMVKEFTRLFLDFALSGAWRW